MSGATLNDIVTSIISAEPPGSITTKIVGIDGCGGSGKSTLAANLAAQLPDAQIIHTDDFASWDNPLNWWPRLLEQVLTPLMQNRAGRYQRYDWGAGELAEWHDVPAGGIVLIEGVSALRREFRGAYALGIFVNTPRALRLERGLARDGTDALAQWQDWMAAEDAYIADHKPQEFARYVVNGADSELYKL